MAYSFSIPRRIEFPSGGSEISTITTNHTYTTTTRTVINGNVGTSNTSRKWTWTSDGHPLPNGYSPSNTLLSKTNGHSSLNRNSLSRNSRLSEVPILDLPTFTPPSTDRYKSLRDFYPSKSTRLTSTKSRDDLYRKYNLVSSAMLVSNEVGQVKLRCLN